MKLNLKYFLFCLIATCIFIGCKEEERNLWSQYKEIKFGRANLNDTIYKKLLLKFENASPNAFVALSFLDDQDQFIQDADFLVGDKKAKGGKLILKAKDFVRKDTLNQLGFVFKNPAIEPGFGHLFRLKFSEPFNGKIRLKVSESDFDLVNEVPLSEIEPFEWKARLKVPFWKVIVFFTLLALIGLLLFWFLIAKPSMYPQFKVGEVHFLDPKLAPIKLKGKTKLIIGGQQKLKQGFLSRLFTGSATQILSNYNFNVEIVPKRRGVNTYARLKANPTINVKPRKRSNLKNYDEFEIKHEGEDIKFRYQESR